jgi:hypothetical protein
VVQRYETDGTPGVGLATTDVVRVGSAVLVATIAGVVTALCVFATDPC